METTSNTSTTNPRVGDTLHVTYPERATNWASSRPRTVLAGGIQHRTLAACGCTFKPVSA